MKKLFPILALAFAAQAAHADLTVSGASVVNFQNYDSTPASFTGTINQGVSGTLMAQEAGTISFTYLGKEAWNTNQFNFNGQRLKDDSREGLNNLLGTTFTANIAAGKVNFSFTDVTRGVTYQNGSTGAMVTSTVVPGTMAPSGAEPSKALPVSQGCPAFAAARCKSRRVMSSPTAYPKTWERASCRSMSRPPWPTSTARSTTRRSRASAMSRC